MTDREWFKAMGPIPGTSDRSTMPRTTKPTRVWLIEGPDDRRHYRSDASMLSGWLNIFRRDPRATITVFTDSGSLDASAFISTFEWTVNDTREWPVNDSPESLAAWHHHQDVCRQDPDKVQAILRGKHQCPWFDFEAKHNRAQLAEKRRNAKLLAEWISQH